MGRSPFGFCMNTSTIRCGDTGLEEKIRVTADAGYDGIEPWVSELDEFAAGGGNLADLGKRTLDSGLEIVNLIGFFEWAAPDEERRRAGLAEARRNFEMASTLGCRHVAAPPWGIHTHEGLDLFAIAERYANLIKLGREYDVVPILEFWGIAKTLGKLGEALLVAAECGQPEACILADIFHMYKGSGHFEGLRLLAPRTLKLLHVNDYPAVPPRHEIADAQRVYPGDGIAPLRDILRDLSAAGYDGMLSLELFNRDYWEESADTVAQTGLDKLARLIE